MPRSINVAAEESKPLVVRVPLSWYEAIQRHALKGHRNLQGQMLEIVELYLREKKELPANELVSAGDD
jgi:hypothetical protein